MQIKQISIEQIQFQSNEINKFIIDLNLNSIRQIYEIHKIYLVHQLSKLIYVEDSSLNGLRILGQLLSPLVRNRTVLVAPPY